MNDDRYWQCTRKQAYRTHWKAFLAEQNARRRTGEQIAIYKCPHCHQWHIGHQPRRAT